MSISKTDTMRKILLLCGLSLSLIAAKAQYTITDANGDPVADGATVNVELPNANDEISVHWRLHSATVDTIRFQVLSTSQAEGTVNSFCVGVKCYPPNYILSEPQALDTNNEAALILYYKPQGIADPALINYKIYSNANPNIYTTFSISFTIATGIKENSQSEKLLAYPNPANSFVKITYQTNENAELVLYNIVGEKVRNYPIAIGSKEIKIDTSELPAGTYFYSIVSEFSIKETKRLVVKH